MVNKPTQEVVNIFLHKLQDSGVTNMFGATSYIENQWPDLSEDEAEAMLKVWMNTWDEAEHKAALEADVLYEF